MQHIYTAQHTRSAQNTRIHIHTAHSAAHTHTYAHTHSLTWSSLGRVARSTHCGTHTHISTHTHSLTWSSLGRTVHSTHCSTHTHTHTHTHPLTHLVVLGQSRNVVLEGVGHPTVLHPHERDTLQSVPGLDQIMCVCTRTFVCERMRVCVCMCVCVRVCVCVCVGCAWGCRALQQTAIHSSNARSKKDVKNTKLLLCHKSFSSFCAAHVFMRKCTSANKQSSVVTCQHTGLCYTVPTYTNTYTHKHTHTPLVPPPLQCSGAGQSSPSARR